RAMCFLDNATLQDIEQLKHRDHIEYAELHNPAKAPVGWYTNSTLHVRRHDRHQGRQQAVNSERLNNATNRHVDHNLPSRTLYSDNFNINGGRGGLQLHSAFHLWIL